MSKVIIIVDKATTTQLNEIQGVIKAHSKTWWHQFTNVWIVDSETTAWTWVSWLNPLLTGGAGVLAFDAPKNEVDRGWSMVAPDGVEKSQWLYEFYKGPAPIKEPSK